MAVVLCVVQVVGASSVCRGASPPASLRDPTVKPKESWTSKVGSAWKSGTEKAGTNWKNGTAKVGSWFKPKPSGRSPAAPEKTLKPKADLFVAMAQVAENDNKPEEAEKLYQRALKAEPNDLSALLGYAHLLDRRGELDNAIRYYAQAAEKHPQAAAPLNDLGLCYHRCGRLNEAEQALRRAVKLSPSQPLYRNNLAAVLVDQNKPLESLAELQAVHPEAVAHYNLGYLLVKKGNRPAALYHFQQAVARNPSLSQAQSWVNQLSPPPQFGPQLSLNQYVRPPQAVPPRTSPAHAAPQPAVPSWAPQPRIAQRPPVPGSAPAFLGSPDGRVPPRATPPPPQQQPPAPPRTLRYPQARANPERSPLAALPPTPEQIDDWKNPGSVRRASANLSAAEPKPAKATQR